MSKTTKKGSQTKKQPKKVVSVPASMRPTQEEIAERAAEVRAGWALQAYQPRCRGVNQQGMYRVSSELPSAAGDIPNTFVGGGE